MPTNQVNIYEPRFLAEVVRTAPPIHTFFLDSFFTNVKTFVTNRVDIDIVKGDRRMAAFVHPRAGGPGMGRPRHSVPGLRVSEDDVRQITGRRVPDGRGSG